MFTCCHPALSFEAQVALTLRTLAGMTTPEIARAFLVGEPTMAQRWCGPSARSATPASPSGSLRPISWWTARPPCLAVLYLLFNEGYAASGARPGPPGLSAEAIRLTRTLCTADARRARGARPAGAHAAPRRPPRARVDAGGDLVLLEPGPHAVGRGRHRRRAQVLDAALRLRRPGPFQVQAAIAACHAQAIHAADTDWVGDRRPLRPPVRHDVHTAVVFLNRAVAVGMARRRPW
jgi:RNA polymerase sigma-70 factor (ECF subfamily)